MLRTELLVRVRALESMSDVSEDERTIKLVNVFNLWLDYIVRIVMYVICTK